MREKQRRKKEECNETERENDNEDCVVVGSTEVVHGKKGDDGRVYSEVVVLERCELEVNVRKQNGRNKGQGEEGAPLC